MGVGGGIVVPETKKEWNVGSIQGTQQKLAIDHPPHPKSKQNERAVASIAHFGTCESDLFGREGGGGLHISTQHLPRCLRYSFDRRTSAPAADAIMPPAGGVGRGSHLGCQESYPIVWGGYIKGNL